MHVVQVKERHAARTPTRPRRAVDAANASLPPHVVPHYPLSVTEEAVSASKECAEPPLAPSTYDVCGGRHHLVVRNRRAEPILVKCDGKFTVRARAYIQIRHQVSYSCKPPCGHASAMLLLPGP